MFFGCTSLESLGNIGDWDMRSIVTTNYMFYGCTSLTDLGTISDWNYVPNFMESMFDGCTSLESLGDIGNWTIRQGLSGAYTITVARMFQNCKSLVDLGNIGNWFSPQDPNSKQWTQPSGITEISMNSMFNGCTSLVNLGNINKWDTRLVTGMNSMFRYCENLGVPEDYFSNDCNWDTSWAYGQNKRYFSDGANQSLCDAIKYANEQNSSLFDGFITSDCKSS
jgi:surface protein